MIAWAQAHNGDVVTQSIAPSWLQSRAGRWAYLLERADKIDAENDGPVPTADLPLSRLQHLTELRLYGRGVGDDLIGEVGRLRELTVLRLGNTAVTDAGLVRLSACQRLQRLELWGSLVGNRGLAPLMNHPGLTFLNLYNTAVDDRSMPVLKSLSKLEDLYLEETKVTPAQLAQLRTALPRCRIDHANGN